MGIALERPTQGPGVDGYIPGKQGIKRWETIAGIALVNGYCRGAELGVSWGRFSTFLCSRVPNMNMLAVDLWGPQPENVGRPGAEAYDNEKYWPHEKKFQTLKDHIAQYFPGRIKLMRMLTNDAAKLVDDESLDFVFIDADHSYEGCAADIANWTPKVRQGGLVSGHDINWPTVLKAVKESGDFITASDNVWLRYKPEFP